LAESAAVAKTAGETTQQQTKGKILEFAWHLKKENLADSTIATFIYALNKLQKNGADLSNSDSVKDALTRINLAENSKTTIIAAYTCFLRSQGKSWNPPKHSYQQKIPFIPLESELDALIAGANVTYSALLQLLKETAMRIGEAARLKWTDINAQSNTVILNLPEKGSNPRIFKASPKLISMIHASPKKGERVFGNGRVRDKQHVFQHLRNKLARKLGNPRLTQITFHTFRHWKGTIEYHKTHDIMHVKQLLGHRNIQSTMIYINLEQAVFATEDDEFNVKVASTLEEACKLMEVGFEYVTDMDDKKLFRKRK
jgi:integrase